VLVLEENKCSELMLSNRVKAALLSPIGYGQAVVNADYRIIPGPALATYYFTGLSSILFKEGVNKINAVSTKYPESFIVKIGLQLLKENYQMNPEVIKEDKPLSDSIADASIILGKAPSGKGLDISEEWYMFSDLSLPLAFWVCRSEEYPENIIDIIKELSDKSAEQEEIISEYQDQPPSEENRTGKLIRHWNDEFESGLEYTLKFLFYLQHIPEIPAIKVLGRDEIKHATNSIEAILQDIK
jgi:predicted solute-binding protein